MITLCACKVFILNEIAWNVVLTFKVVLHCFHRLSGTDGHFGAFCWPAPRRVRVTLANHKILPFARILPEQAQQ